MASQLPAPRLVWVMVPAGTITEGVIAELSACLMPGDIVVDGGNSNFHDTVRRAKSLADNGITLLDVGTSGGIWGLKEGYCLMVGGDKAAFDRIEPVLKTLAPPEGYLYIGPSGAGHYVKMIHNGIEYALMQAYAEGFDILQASEYDIDLTELCHLWNRGSVVRSWLLELAERAFAEDPGLEKISDYVEDSGEGRWTVQEAIDRSVPATSIAYALMARFRSRQTESFAGKVLAALRNQFGGHPMKERADGLKD
jgi:6-phosphogluconate dehydrogenase